MTQRPRRSAKVVSMPEAPDPWRLKWIEADIKALKENGLPELRKLIDAHTDQLTKINRNLLIMGFAIMGMGVASKVFSGPIADVVKNLLGI